MSQRIYFSHWGNTKHLEIPSYAMRGCSLNSKAGMVAAAVARKNKLFHIGTTYDGYAPDDDCDIYELTFGTRCPTGGWNVEATLWVSIKRGG